jgi:carbon storage regulator CsrA
LKGSVVLVLSRKRNEDILIKTPEGHIVTIRVVEIIGEKVKLGFVADDCVSIMRKELVSTKEAKDGLERPVAGRPLYPAS